MSSGVFARPMCGDRREVGIALRWSRAVRHFPHLCSRASGGASQPVIGAVPTSWRVLRVGCASTHELILSHDPSTDTGGTSCHTYIHGEFRPVSIESADAPRHSARVFGALILPALEKNGY